LVCLAVGVVVFVFGYRGVDVSVSRYFAFVAGGALLVAGCLLLSRRAVALVLAVFVAGVALEGPISADSAAAFGLLDGARVPGYQAVARGFVGPARDFPYRVFAGPPSAVSPFMFDPPDGFTRDPLNYAAPEGPYTSEVASGPARTTGALAPSGPTPELLQHEGFARLASWRGPRTGGTGQCIVELEVADTARLKAALSEATPNVRLKLEGKAVIRLISSCGPVVSPAPQPGPSGSQAPSSGPTLRPRRGAPR
jgi:hypothetical protein